MRKEFEMVDWDDKKRSLVITKQETIPIDGAKNIQEVKQILTDRLKMRVRQIKELKADAQNIKLLLDKLNGKADSIEGPAQFPE
jgi:hypothetical protein